MLSNLLLEWNDVWKIHYGRSGAGALHEFEPDRKGGSRAGLFFPQRNLFVVEAHPRTGGELWRVNGKPSIGISLCCASLPSRRARKGLCRNTPTHVSELLGNERPGCRALWRKNTRRLSQ